MGCNARQPGVPCASFHDQQALRKFFPRNVGLPNMFTKSTYSMPPTHSLIARDRIRDRYWTPQEPPSSVFTYPDPFRRQSTPFGAVRFPMNLLRNIFNMQRQELPMQVDPAKIMATTADTVPWGGIGMTPLSGAFRVGRFSLDAMNTCELEFDRKLSFNTTA